MRNCNFLRPECRALMLGLFFFTSAVNAQNTFTNLAGEYAVIGNLPGDQVASHVALGSDGGWVVWQDNATDGFGAGISARRLGSSLSGDFNAFRVNQIGQGDQENPQAAVLKNGGLAIAWQGGPIGKQDIYLRLLDANGVFQTSDTLVNTHTNLQQAQPAIACLEGGNVAVAWSSYGQDGSMQGVYAKVFSAAGAAITGDIAVNQTTYLNQRSPKIAALADGSFVVVWVSEAVRSGGSATNVSSHVVSIMARVIDPVGAVVGNEFPLSGSDIIGAQPVVAAKSDGGFLAAWGQLTSKNTNSWDVRVRSFGVDRVPVFDSVVINTYTHGDQFAPKMSISGTNALVVWTSMGQDESYEGVFGRLLTTEGVVAGPEFRVNTTELHKQVQPAIASDASGRFVVTWSSFIGGASSFDLFAQRYSLDGAANGLIAPDAPYISSLSTTQLSATWPGMAGYPVAFYELHQDGLSTPVVVAGLQAVISSLAPGSNYTFRLLYQLTDGRRSPLSAPVQGKTWGEDLNGDGLPDDWQSSVWGATAAWPAANVDSDGDGASNLSEFWAGTSPTDPLSVLKTRLQRTPQGMRFSWNTQPGFVYQVQRAVDLGSWVNVGSQRFAAGSFDLIQVDAGEGPAFYRVICLR